MIAPYTGKMGTVKINIQKDRILYSKFEIQSVFKIQNYDQSLRYSQEQEIQNYVITVFFVHYIIR